MRVLIVKPHTMTHRNTGRIRGTGMGSVLLNGSAGVAATMTNDAPTLDNLKGPSGTGLGKQIAAKLDKLRVQAKKIPENIKFSI